MPVLNGVPAVMLMVRQRAQATTGEPVPQSMMVSHTATVRVDGLQEPVGSDNVIVASPEMLAPEPHVPAPGQLPVGGPVVGVQNALLMVAVKEDEPPHGVAQGELHVFGELETEQVPTVAQAGACRQNCAAASGAERTSSTVASIKSVAVRRMRTSSFSLASVEPAERPMSNERPREPPTTART